MGAPAAVAAGAGAVVTVLVVVAGTVFMPEPPGRTAIPAAGTLAHLEPYLEPVDEDAVVLDPARPGMPATVTVRGDPFRAGAAPGPAVADEWPDWRPEPAASPPPRWTLSAIMVAGDRRIAIINDQVARPGDRLEDGARVAAVADDHVIIITPAGERRRLELAGQ